jgi:hypothetical protein
MKTKALIPLVALLLAVASAAGAQQTPPTIVASYDSLADTILAVRQAEYDFVRALLDGHRHAAEVLMKQGEYDRAAGEIALFANEGDNAIGGVRKRLLEGGHHHNAAGEEKGEFEPGYVIVTREAKQKGLELSRELRQASSDAARKEIWAQFAEMADELLQR